MAEIRELKYTLSYESNMPIIEIATSDLPRGIKLKRALVTLKSACSLKTDSQEIKAFYAKCWGGDSDSGIIVDKIHSIGLGDTIRIDVTDELQSALDKKQTIKLEFEKIGDTVAVPLSFADPETITSADRPTCDVEYISKAEYSANGTTHSVNLGTAGDASINLNTGVLSIAHGDIQTDSNVLPLSIAHTYNSFGAKLPIDSSISNHYGAGWRLNLEQYLVEKTIDIPAADGKTTQRATGEYEYFDQNGKKQIIQEKLFYEYTDDSGEITKKFVERTDENLSMNLNGDLQYNSGTAAAPKIHSIKTEFVAPSGLKLVTSKSDIKGANLVDSEPDELLQLREQIKNLEFNKKSLKDSIENSKKQLITLVLSKKSIKTQLDIQAKSLDSSQEELIFLEKTQEARGGEAHISATTESGTSNAEKINQEDYYKTYGRTEVSDADYKYIGAYNIQESIYNLNNIIYSNGLKKVELSDLVKQEMPLSDYEQIFINKNTQEDSVEQYYDEILKANKNTDIQQIQISYKDVYSTDIQIKSLIKNLNNYKEQLEYCQNDIQKLTHQIHDYERQIPQFYLYSDTVIYGFSPIIVETTEDADVNLDLDNETDTSTSETDTSANEADAENYLLYRAVPHIFRLNYIADTYENSIAINYDKATNKIESIIDSQENEITFEYKTVTRESGAREKEVIITDAADRKVTFVLHADRLVETIYNDGTRSRYLYDLEGRLIAAIGANGIGAKFTYTNKNVGKIEEISVLESVQNGKENYKNFEFSLDTLPYLNSSNGAVIIEYKDYTSTTITSFVDIPINDSQTRTEILKKQTYVFAPDGRVRTVYENVFDESNPNITPIARSFDYIADTTQISVEPLLNSINYLDDACFAGNAVVQVPANYFGNGLLEGGEIYCGDDIYCESYPVHTKYHAFPSPDGKYAQCVCVSDTRKDELNALIENSAHGTVKLVLGGWAKADSAFVFNPDDGGDLGGCPEYIRDRKFELRARITYTDDLTVEYTKCFDWRNTDWQYCAVPVDLYKYKQIKSFEGYFDFTDNTIAAPVYFTDLTLKEAKFEQRYYENKLVKKVIRSHSKWGQTFDYDENDRLIKSYYVNLDDNNGELLANEFFYNKKGKLFKTIDFKGIVTEKVFNENGIEIQTKKYHKDNPSEILFTEQKLGEKGEVLADYNELGAEINKYEYVAGTGIVSNIVDKQGNKTAYGYDTKNGTLLQMSSDVDSISNTNTFGYTLGFLTKVSHNDFDISYDYDSRGRMAKIKVAGSDYLTFNYAEDETNTISMSSYSNGESFKTKTDKDGNVTEVYYKPKPTEAFPTPEYALALENVYDTHGNLIAVNDKVNGTTIQYTLDKFGNTTLQTDTQHAQSLKKENIFDIDNNNTSTTYTIGANTQNYGYTYDTTKPESVLTGITLPTGATQSIENDNLGRTKEITLLF